MKLLVLLLALTAFPAILPSFADVGSYDLIVDENVFSIEFNFDGKLVAMNIDKESRSLLVGTTGVQDSEFLITFSSKMLSAENNDFVVLVDGFETDYITSHADDKISITFPVVSGSEEIEIIGTSVIPEFPLGTLAVFGLVGIIIIALTQRHNLFKW